MNSIAATARVESGVILGNNVTIGEHVIIQEGTSISDNCFIGDNCIIGCNSYIDRDVIIRADVALGSDSFIGTRSIIGEFPNDFALCCGTGQKGYPWQNISLEGWEVQLRKLRMTDAQGMLEWMHDPDIQNGFQADMSAMGMEDVRSFIEHSEYTLTDGRSMHFAIANKQDEYMGTISLKDISLRDRRAEFAISLRKCAQGQGIGYKATQLLLQYAFCTLELNRVFLNVLSDNLPAIRLYQKCGFKYEGEFADHLYLRGSYQNLKWYAIEKKDYIEKRYDYENYAKQTG